MAKLRIPKKAAMRVFYSLTGALCVWIVAYGSGLLPYLGWGRAQNNTEFAMSMDFGSISIGLPWMILFEGQTAFYDYASYSEESAITFDVKPFFTLGYSDNMQRVTGEGSGRIEVPITHTGIYTFRHEPALARGHVYTHYSTVWGAN